MIGWIVSNETLILDSTFFRFEMEPFNHVIIIPIVLLVDVIKTFYLGILPP